MRQRWLVMTAAALGLLIFGRGEALAQTSASRSAAVQADVVSGISATRVSDLDFGTLLQGVGSTTLTNTSAGIADFQIQGQQKKRITVTVTVPAALTDGSGNSITYTPAGGYNNAGTGDTPGTLSGTLAFTGQTGSATFKMGNGLARNQGEAYVYIYGTLSGITTATPTGTYSGTITLSVTY